MNITEATAVNHLLRSLGVAGGTPDPDAARKAASVLAGRASKALAAGISSNDVLVTPAFNNKGERGPIHERCEDEGIQAMSGIFDVVIDRGNITAERLHDFIRSEGAVALYDRFIGPAVDQIDDAAQDWVRADEYDGPAEPADFADAPDTRNEHDRSL